MIELLLVAVLGPIIVVKLVRTLWNFMTGLV